MYEKFITLIGNFSITSYTDLLIFFGVIIIILFSVTSFFTFIASIFKQGN